MATGTLGTSARDYPSRVERIITPLTVANIGANQTRKVGTIPAGSGILRASTVVGTAFNSATNNFVSLGTASGGSQLMAGATIGAVGANALTVIAAQMGPLAADTDVWVTGAFTPSPPTLGNALLVIEWANPGAG